MNFKSLILVFGVVVLAVAVGLFWGCEKNDLTAPQGPGGIALSASSSGFLKGVNAPWHNGFWDFGAHHEWGCGYDPNWWETFFSDLENYNANIARVWVFADGRASPNFDENNVNLVVGLDDCFFDDMDDFLSRASNHGVQVILCLWSFDAMKDYTGEVGKYGGNHKEMFVNSTYIQAFLDKALAPMVDRYAGNSAIYSWEIINEPEWAMSISGGGGTPQELTEEQMQNFVGKCAACIHSHGGSGVSVGSASWKWCSTIELKDYWSDSELQAASGESGAYVDIVQVHYYNWMHPWFDCFDYDLSYFYTGSKPVIIGECPAVGDEYHTTQDMINAAYNNGYVGIVYWSYAGVDGMGSWNDCKDEINNFSGGGTTTTSGTTSTTTTAATTSTTTTAGTTTTTVAGNCDCGTCNWYGSNVPACCTQTTGWGWQDGGCNRTCVGCQTCIDAGQTCTNCTQCGGATTTTTTAATTSTTTTSATTSTTTTAATTSTTTTAATTSTTTTAATTTTTAATTTTTSGTGETCSPVDAEISASFTQNGAGEYCWTATSCNYINSWNLSSLTVNGVDFTNKWASGSNLPAKIDGKWYIHYEGNYGWSHFELR
jgi:hypothetical protein